MNKQVKKDIKEVLPVIKEIAKEEEIKLVNEAVKAPEPIPTLKIDKDTLFLVIYMLYTMHVLTQMQVKKALNILANEVPADLAGYLVKEASKA